MAIPITMLTGSGFTTSNVSTSSLIVDVFSVTIVSGEFFPGTVVLPAAPVVLVVFVVLVPPLPELLLEPEPETHVGIPERQSTEPVEQVGA